jgi:hypothetical protein
MNGGARARRRRRFAEVDAQKMRRTDTAVRTYA